MRKIEVQQIMFHRKKSNTGKQNPATIDTYIDDKRNIVIIPTLHTQIGYFQSNGYFKQLEQPYTLTDIGNLFIQVLNDMRFEPILSGEEDIPPIAQMITGGKGYLAFQRKRQMISAYFSEKIEFKYLYRKKRGFGIDKGDKEIRAYLPLDCAADIIGKTIDDIYFEVNKKHLNEA